MMTYHEVLQLMIMVMLQFVEVQKQAMQILFLEILLISIKHLPVHFRDMLRAMTLLEMSDGFFQSTRILVMEM